MTEKERAKKSLPNGEVTLQVDNTTVIIPLSAIVADRDFNARSEVTGDAPTEGGSGFRELCESLVANGQDTPVHVYPLPKGKYKLITGFRRVAALHHIAQQGRKITPWPSWNPKSPTVAAALVAAKEPLHHHILNLRENTSRQNLTAADTCWGLRHVFEHSQYTDSDVANNLGMSQGYVSKLHRILKTVESALIAAWRVSPIQLTVDQMLSIGKLDKVEQPAAYDMLLAGKPRSKPPTDDREDNNGVSKELKTARAHCERSVRILATAWSTGLDFDNPDFGNLELLTLLAGCNRIPSKEEAADLSKACLVAYKLLLARAQ